MAHKFSNFYEVKGKKVIECTECGFFHLYPLPTEVELETFYKELYWQSEANKNSKTEIRGVDSYMCGEEVLEIKEYKEIYDSVEKLLGKTGEAKRMLDVGCGPSSLLSFFKLKNYEVFFIEPSEESVEIQKKRGIEGLLTGFENVDFNSLGQFDFINISFVLEHLRNPIELIQNLKKCLKPNGVLRIAVPNDFSKSHKTYMDKYEGSPEWVCYPDHINYFNFNSLKKTMENNKYKELYRSTSFPLDLLLIQGYDFYKNPKLAEDISDMVKRFEEGFSEDESLLSQYYESLANLGLGRRVIMYFSHE